MPTMSETERYPMPDQAASLLSVTESAAVLGLTRGGVWWLITQGRLPARRIGGRWLLAATTVYAEKEARK